MSQIYLTANELAERNYYDTGINKTYLEGMVLIESIHFFRSVTGRKILYIWEAIEEDIQKTLKDTARALILTLNIPDKLPLPHFIGDMHANSNEEAIIAWMFKKPPLIREFCWSVRDWAVLLYDELSHILEKFN